MADELDEFDQIVEDLGLGNETGESTKEETKERDATAGQQHPFPDQMVGSLRELLLDFRQPTVTHLVAELCRACDWTTEVITNESSSVRYIQARRCLPYPESVRLVNHTASKVTVDAVDELLTENTGGTTTMHTIIVSEPPTDSALEKIQQNTAKVIEIGDLAQDILTQGLTDLVVQLATTDEQIAADHEALLNSLDESVSSSSEKESTGNIQAGDTQGKSGSSQTSIIGEGDHLDIEVVGFDNKNIEFEDRDEDILEEREYTVICLHVKNKTSYEWEFRAFSDLAVTSTDGFSYDNPQSNGWSSRRGQFTPWNNGKRHDIKPNSKVRAVIIYKTWFEPERIEYTADLLHVHGDEDESKGTERISIQIDESTREGIRSLPDSLPIDSVVLN